MSDFRRSSLGEHIKELARRFGINFGDSAVLSVADPKSAMIQFVDGMIAQMIPAVSRQIGITEDELKQQIAQPPLIFSDEISAAYTPVRGGLFAIRLSLPFMAFIYKMTKLWAANLGADTGKGLALPTFTEEETVEWATKLMDAFCEGRIDSAVLPSVSLSKHQLAFAASMATHAERVIVAHEFGHLVIEKFRDGKIPDSHEGKKRRIEGFLRTGKNIAADFLKNDPVVYELAGGAENRGSEEVETAWGDEIAADLLGFQLLDEAEKNDSDRVHNLWAFELFFVTLAMIERYQALRGWDKPALSMHPPTTLRHGLLRIAVKDAWNWDDDSLTVGRYYEGLSNRIIDAIQDRRKKNIVWLDLLREAGKNDCDLVDRIEPGGSVRCRFEKAQFADHGVHQSAVSGPAISSGADCAAGCAPGNDRAIQFTGR